MKSNMLLYLLLLILPANVFAKNENLIQRFGQGRTTQGKEFWIAIPPNEYFNNSLNKNELAIYVTSNKSTTASIEFNGNIVSTKIVNPLEITTFSANNGGLNWSWEVYSSEIVEKKGIRVFSEDPISVFVLNSKQTSSDGFMALPVLAWGKEYIHVSYYDHYQDNSRRGAGFIVVASQDRTIVTVELIGKGKGRINAKTLGGRSIGDTIENIILNRGEIYTVRGNGRTKGVFDLSGSKIISNKPIGLISFNMRTSLSSNINDGRDLLCEMLPPVSSWGRNYTSIEFKRKGKGDFFRIVAARDSTNWRVDWYDLDSKQLLGSREAMLAKSGDFFEYNNSGRNSIKGTAVWKADKPVMVMQYSYSADWDYTENFDPFMVMVVPDEQFVRSAVFQTPDENIAFFNHWLNILAVGDSTDQDNALLKSLTIDGQYLWEPLQSNLLSNRIPGTNLYWAAIDMEPGVHYISGDTKFGAYIYGYGYKDSYGWPAAMAVDDLEVDTLEPDIYVSNPDCGKYLVRVTEVRNGDISDIPTQVDSGIDSVWLAEGSNNFELVLDSTVDLGRIESVTGYAFKLNVINTFETAKTIFNVADKAGNIAIYSLSFPPDDIVQIDVSYEYIQDSLLIPGDTIELPIRIDCDNWDYINLNTIALEIIYNHKWMYYTGSFRYGIILKDLGWAASVEVIEIDDSTNSLLIRANGERNIKSSGTFLLPFFVLLLAPDAIYRPAVRTSDSIRYQLCLGISGDTAIVTINICALNIRSVVNSENDFSFNNISPNPIEEHRLNLRFSVGFKANTTIEIFDSYGSKIQTIYNQAAEPGKHYLAVSLNDLPSGAYLIKFTSGPYVKTRRFILTK